MAASDTLVGGVVRPVPLHTTRPIAGVTYEAHAGGEVHDALQSVPVGFDAGFTVALARGEAAGLAARWTG